MFRTTKTTTVPCNIQLIYLLENNFFPQILLARSIVTLNETISPQGIIL